MHTNPVELIPQDLRAETFLKSTTRPNYGGLGTHSLPSAIGNFSSGELNRMYRTYTRSLTSKPQKWQCRSSGFVALPYGAPSHTGSRHRHSGIMLAAQTQLTAAGLLGHLTRFPFNPQRSKPTQEEHRHRKGTQCGANSKTRIASMLRSGVVATFAFKIYLYIGVFA